MRRQISIQAQLHSDRDDLLTTRYSTSRQQISSITSHVCSGTRCNVRRLALRCCCSRCVCTCSTGRVKHYFDAASSWDVNFSVLISIIAA
eukprot:15589-Heterococcus_DN1.PRE.2